jgi:hypothetical protein
LSFFQKFTSENENYQEENKSECLTTKQIEIGSVWDLERGIEVYRLQEHEQKITSTDLQNYLCVTSDSRGIVKV